MKVIQRIEIKNFLWTEYRYVDFSEKNDSILIVGENAKGKTTIMRGIYFGLTGEDAFFGTSNLDSVIRDGADEMNINMEMLSSDNTSIYYIEISKKLGKSLKIKIHENGTLLNTSDLITDAKEILNELFGNPLSIRNTYFMFSSSDDDFVNATNSRRLEIITKSSNIFTEYELISDSAKTMVVRKNDEKIRLQGEYDNENNRLLENETSLNDLEVKLIESLGENIDQNGFEKFSNDTEAYQNLLRKTFDSITEKEKLENEISSIQSIDINALKLKIEEDDINNEFNKSIFEKTSLLRVNISNLMKGKEVYNKELSIRKEKKARLESTIISLNKQLTPISDEELSFRVDNFDFSSIETELKNRKLQIDDTKSYGVKLNTNIESKQDEVKKTSELFNHSKECPVCHSELTEKALQSYIDKIQGEIDILVSERDVLRENYKVINDEYTSLERTYNANVKIYSNENIFIEISKNEEDLSTIETSDLIVEITSIENEITSIENEITSIEKQKRAVLAGYERNDIKNKIETAGSIDSKITRIYELDNLIKGSGYSHMSKYDINTELANIKTFADSVKFMFGQYSNIKKSLYDNKAKIVDIQNGIELVKKDIEQYDYLRSVFGKNGIQKEQIEHILRSVEMETNGMVNKFFDNIGVRFTYDGNGIGLEIMRQVISDMGIEYKSDVLKNFSDAQQEVLKTLLKLSFSKVLQYLNGTPLNIIFLNETFNTLSVNKEEELVSILKYFAEEYQVFFITHNQSLISKYENDSIVRLT